MLLPGFVPEFDRMGGPARLVGAVLVTAGLTAVVLPIVEGQQQAGRCGLLCWPAPLRFSCIRAYQRFVARRVGRR